MKMSTAIAMLCRFYGFSISEVLSMTLRLFNTMLNEVGVILRMEHGSDEPKENKPMTGNAGFALAQTLIPKGRRNA